MYYLCKKAGVAISQPVVVSALTMMKLVLANISMKIVNNAFEFGTYIRHNIENAIVK